MRLSLPHGCAIEKSLMEAAVSLASPAMHVFQKHFGRVVIETQFTFSHPTASIN